MRLRVIIVHGWGGHPGEGWFPWLKAEMERVGAVVLVPAMPDPSRPDIFAWVRYLRDIAEPMDEQTFFTGHSLGAQGILRLLQELPDHMHVGGCVFVAGFEHLGGRFHASAEAQSALHQWLITPMHWETIRKHTKNFHAIFSDNDDWVPLSNVKVFDEKLGATTEVFHRMGHFSGSDGTTELPIARDALLQMMGLETKPQP